MLVYGDRRELVEPTLRLAEINRRLESIARMARGLERHSSLSAALVETGELLQGFADAAFEDSRCDRLTPPIEHLGTFLTGLGHALCRSWDSAFQEIGELTGVQLGCELPAQVEIRKPEGFAFYGVYPEAYIEAARRLRLAAPPRVIGTRSIGTSLAAAVAAAIDAPPPVTVRPFGDPSARKVACDPALERDLLGEQAHYVIVDEGPGQSGSSFGAVADWLKQRGVPAGRIAVLPSHAGAPGPAVSQDHLKWWSEVQRQPADFGDRWPELIERWCGTLLGPLDDAPQDISAGAWRALHYEHEGDWPASIPALERRKFLVRARGEKFLVKFAGLGRTGEEKLSIARTLHSEGLTPEPVGLAHGFLVERWREDASPIGGKERPLAEIARYIGSRGHLLPAASGSGATVEELLEMIRRNLSLELGEALTRALDPWQRIAAELERRIVRVCGDNRLGRAEWLRTNSGALIKTDALDHHQAHDLIGCQDLAWDVAGAVVEFDVDQNELGGFVASVEQWACRDIDHALLEFYRVAYLAFRLGQERLGLTIAEDRLERRRLAECGDCYADALRLLLERTCSATRPESLVG